MSEKKAPGPCTKLLNAAWLRPFLLLVLIVVGWDLAIRLFNIPAYQIPAPGDVVEGAATPIGRNCCGSHGRPPMPRCCGFLLSARVRHSRRDADRGLEDGRELRLSAAGVLAVDSEGRDRAAVRGVVRFRHHAEGRSRRSCLVSSRSWSRRCRASSRSIPTWSISPAP